MLKLVKAFIIALSLLATTSAGADPVSNRDICTKLSSASICEATNNLCSWDYEKFMCRPNYRLKQQ